jgi:hypothetical protein
MHSRFRKAFDSGMEAAQSESNAQRHAKIVGEAMYGMRWEKARERAVD